MFGSVGAAIIVAFLKVAILFVPRTEYVEKVENITPVEEKNIGFDLKGWEYRSIEGTDLDVTHRYYQYPSEKPNAPVLLCLHGLLFDGRTFLHLRGLSDEFTLIAYDMPENCPGYTGAMINYSEIIRDFLVTQRIGRYTLLGVSFGGIVAVHTAARLRAIRPPEALVIVSTQIAGMDRMDSRNLLRNYRWISTLPDHKYYWIVEKIINKLDEGYDGERGSQMQQMLRVRHIQYYRQLGASMIGHNSLQDAHEVSCPALVLHGEKDQLFTEEQMMESQKALWPAVFRVVENGTHAMTFMRGEEIAGYVRDYCETIGVIDRQVPLVEKNPIRPPKEEGGYRNVGGGDFGGVGGNLEQ